jgi:hypothetical protein
VIKTIPLDMFLCFGMGLLFSIAALKGGQPEGSLFKTRHFWMSMTYMVLFTIGVVVFGYIIEPDWMWMYFLDYREVPLALEVYAFLFYPIIFCFGYMMAPELEKVRPGLANGVYYAVNVAIVVVILAFIKRLWHVGTLQEFMNDNAPGFITLDPPRMLLLGWLLAAGTPIAGFSLIWLYRRISREALQHGSGEEQQA